LDPTTRAFFEPRFGYDFAHVRVHRDSEAANSARSINALAYTLGSNIVFGAGQYAPETNQGSKLIAHELAHVTQQQAVGTVALQRQSAAAPATAGATQPAQAVAPSPPPPREDYVFIMGQDIPGSGNSFYQFAERFYRAQVPGATFVNHVTNLTDLLDYIARNASSPIGNVYIVSHANEDGTLGFGLNSADPNGHLDLPELRDALHPGSGTSALTQVSAQIDGQTRIHIKGCDIGRTAGMVELIDEAFGGAGTVTAPTHEQIYGFDSSLADAERARTQTQMLATFTATLPPVPPMPAAVPRSLRGAARQQAMTDRAAAVQARQQVIQDRRQAIADETQRIIPDLDEAAERAGTYEALSGPMFQRPGTTLFSASELQPEVQRLYSHLSREQQADLVRRLIARDPRPAATANQQGTGHQTGQLVYTVRDSFPVNDPRTLAEVNIVYASQLQQQNFTATRLRPIQRRQVPRGTELTIVVEGQVRIAGQDPVNNTLTFTDGPVLNDAAVIADARAQSPNPDRYRWRVEETHSSAGITTRTAVAERVVAYLHHGSLDPSAHSHFTRPESDPNFFATSTFAPPPAQPAHGSGP
jgi:hypothetical protein